MKKYEVGLIVGKFSPLHFGHEYLIKEAARQCDKLYIICYSNLEFFKCDVDSRRRWLTAATYGLSAEFIVLNTQNVHEYSTLNLPDNDASADAHRNFCARLCFEHFQTEVDAVFSSEDYGDGFAEFLTAFFKNYLNSKNIVEHVCVDLTRAKIPISATTIRENRLGLEESLKRLPYSTRASWIPRVAILGGESTGKTTLAKALNAELNQAEEFVIKEFGRYLWEAKKGKLKYQDMLKIAQTQIDMEHNAAFWAEPHRVLICDTNAVTTLFYSMQLFNGYADPKLIELGAREYDAYILCEPDFEFVQDGTRQDVNFRQIGHDFFSLHVDAKSQFFGIPVLKVNGSVEDRVQQCVKFMRENKIIG